MRWLIRGVKPASWPRVRAASWSAVLREFTIHGRSAQRGEVGRPRRGLGLRDRQAPREVHSGTSASVAGGCGRGEVVVVGQREVQVVVLEQGEGLERLVLADHHLHLGVAPGQRVDDGEQRGADRGREPPDADRSLGLGAGSRSSRAASTAARMVTAWSARRRPAGVSRTRRPSGSTSGVPDLAGQRRDLLRDRGGGQPVGLGDLAHRSQAGQLEEQVQAADVHRAIVQRIVNGTSTQFTWTRTVLPRSLDAMTLTQPLTAAPHHGQAASLAGAHRRPDGDRLDAVRAARPRRLGGTDRPARRRGRGLAPTGLGGGADGAHRSPLAGAVHPLRPRGQRAARRGDRGTHPAVHGGRRPAAARDGQRPGVPRPARGGGCPWPWRAPAHLASCSPASVSCCSPSPGRGRRTRSAWPSRWPRRAAGRRTSC